MFTMAKSLYSLNKLSIHSVISGFSLLFNCASFCSLFNKLPAMVCGAFSWLIIIIIFSNQKVMLSTYIFFWKYHFFIAFLLFLRFGNGVLWVMYVFYLLERDLLFFDDLVFSLVRLICLEDIASVLNTDTNFFTDFSPLK